MCPLHAVGIHVRRLTMRPRGGHGGPRKRGGKLSVCVSSGEADGAGPLGPLGGAPLGALGLCFLRGSRVCLMNHAEISLLWGPRACAVDKGLGRPGRQMEGQKDE